MNNADIPSNKYKHLLEFLHQDLDEDEANVIPVNRDALLAGAQQRAGRLRFVRAKQALITERARQSKFSDLPTAVVAKAREILGLLVSEEPALKAKYSLAFRKGNDLPEEEVERAKRASRKRKP
jgi:hypothetical protein